MSRVKSTISAAGFIIATLGTVTPALAGGGPDAFGYVWLDSNDPMGPAAEWVDITAVGTPVTGLSDDNASERIDLPATFRYYWRDETQLTVGSNGWVSFDPVSNIAHCFPSIPTQGGAADGYLAPLMSDLIFSGAGNPASAWTYYDSLTDRFIISYVDVPRWQGVAPGYDTTRSSFQVILDYNDNSIRFNYLQADAFADNPGCATDVVVGIESPQGQIGLMPNQETLPAAPISIDFIPPLVPLIPIIDPTVAGAMNPQSAGMFFNAGREITLSATIANDGDTDTTGGVDVRGQLLNGGTLFDQTLNEADLAAAETRVVTFDPDVTIPAGRSVLQVDLTNASDINPGNNSRSVEIIGLPEQQAGITLDYVGAESATGGLSWNAASPTTENGLGMFIALDGPMLRLRQVGAYMVGGTCLEYVLELRDNDGVDGLPGSLLSSVVVPNAAIVVNTWQDFDLPTSVFTDADGLYVVWKQIDDCLLGTSQSGTPSRRNLELVGGSFATYRYNDTRDPFLSVTGDTVELFSDGLEDVPL